MEDLRERLAPLIFGFGLFFQGLTFSWEEVYAYNRRQNPFPETIEIIEKEILDVAKEKGWDGYWGMELLKVILSRVPRHYYDVMFPYIKSLIAEGVKPKVVIEFIEETINSLYIWRKEILRKPIAFVPLEIRLSKLKGIAEETYKKITKR